MSKKTIIIGSVILVALVVFIWMFAGGDGKKKEGEIIAASWLPNYKYDSRDPYGAYIFYQLISETTLDFETHEGNPYDVLNGKTGIVENVCLVIYAAGYVNYDYLWNKIDQFVEEGNKVLFILEDDPDRLGTYYNGFLNVTSHSALSTSISFTTSKSVDYKYEWLNNFEPIMHIWKDFSLKYGVRIERDSLNDHPAVFKAFNGSDEYYFIVHEENDRGKPVYIEVPYGDGAVFIHRTPIAFTNLALLSEKNVEHLEQVLDVIDYSGVIYNTHVPVKPPPNPDKARVSPLQFVLSEPALSWAYYILLFSLILFLIFNLKRKQRAVVVLPARENTTIEFADALSKIYYQKHNNSNIVKHKNRIFVTFIRTHYHIVRGKNEEEYARLISAKSGMELKQVEELVNTFDRFQKLKDISDEQLVTLHNLLNNFYKFCK